MFAASQRRLVSRIDIRVIPVLSIMYLLAFLDRTNIANASVFGLNQDLGLVGSQYNTALTMFFVPYIAFEIPSNIILKKLKPHVWLSACMFLFGLVTICQGLVHNYSGLLATRFFLGLAETGMFPGSFYLIGMWYKRSEAQKRYSFFFGSTSLAGAFGGLLASAIGKMNGMRGYLGWRWIFILGICSLCAFFPEASVLFKNRGCPHMPCFLHTLLYDSRLSRRREMVRKCFLYISLPTSELDN